MTHPTPIPASQLPTIGTAFEGGFFGGLIRSNDTLQAILWAPKAHGETTGALFPSRGARVLVPEGTTNCHDSQANTVALASLGSPLAQWALGLQINGRSGWCIPARDVLELGYRHLKPGTWETAATFRDGDNPGSVPPGYPYTTGNPTQTTVEAFRLGGPEAFGERTYLASTLYGDSSAWFQNFRNGGQSVSYLSAERAVRAVCLIPVL